ncbi:zinc-dependent alcohol dehydrogenase family protein [Streptacidiphilus albus]|uniref:zinc-dependent alcohol dehydrogenase family protein n=1 Tax=Streptacidiphilus albus TaxID=105425 RepID=UPI00054B61BB|nr:NAD(P)-dependent alcohol dehydrogenase [Streptacidiphilus albus]
MKSYHLDPAAGERALTVREHPDPRPGAGQAVVRVRASSLSFRELMVLDGDYPLPIRPDVVPVCAGAGEVVAVGAGVGRVAVGDRVMPGVFPRWLDGPFAYESADQLGSSLDGMLTELALLDAEGLVPVPEHLSYEEAAALPLTAVTAWNALTGGRPPMPGETVLTLGSGSVSLFALQLATAAGARVIATTSGPEKARRLRGLGADAVVDRRSTPDWEQEVRALTGGRGVDRVVEVAGTLERSLKAVALDGEVAFVGHWLAREQARAVPLDVLFGSVARLRCVAVGSRAQFTAMNRAVTAHRLRPVVDRVFPFAEAPAAFRHVRAGGHLGTTVISHG